MLYYTVIKRVKYGGNMDKEKKYVLKKTPIYAGLTITGIAIIAGCAYRAINSGNNGDDIVLVPVTSTPKLSPTDSVKPTKAVTPTEGVKPTDSVKPTNAPTPTPNLILDARNTAINEISNFIDGYGKENYSEENNALLEEIKNNAIASISILESNEEIKNIIDKAKEDAGNVETIEETNEKIKNQELSSFKSESLNEIDHKYEDFKTGNNSKEELNKAKTLFEETNNKIKDGGDIDSVKAIVNSFNNDLNNIITERENRIAKEEKDKQDKINEENRKKELETARKNALSEIDKAYKSYVEKDYSKTNYSKLKSYYVEGSNNIKSCTDISKLDGYKNSAIKKMKSVKNNATLLKEGKEQATSKLKENYKKYKSSDYSESNWSKLKKYYDNALESIKNANNVNSANSIVEEAINNMKKVVNSLKETKDSSLKELENFYNNIDKSLYSKDGKSLLESTYSDYKTEINNSNSTSSVKNTLNEAKEQLNNVETLEQEKNSVYISASVINGRINDLAKRYSNYSKEDVAIWVVGANLDYLKTETIYGILNIDSEEEYNAKAERYYEMVFNRYKMGYNYNAILNGLTDESDIGPTDFAKTIGFDEIFIKENLVTQAKVLEQMYDDLVFNKFDSTPKKKATLTIFSYYCGVYPTSISNLTKLPYLYYKDSNFGPAASYLLDGWTFYLTSRIGDYALDVLFDDEHQDMCMGIRQTSNDIINQNPFYNIKYNKQLVKNR